MKKKVLRGIAIGLIAVMCFSLGVMASDSVVDITAQINYALKMKVDNVEWNPTEDDGSAIRPILYNGRTYLPVRALGEKLGISIDWDGDTQTVYIGNKDWTPITASMIDAHKDMGYTKDSDKLYNGSGVYDFGCFVSKQWIGNIFSTIDIKTDAKFSEMKMGMYASGTDKIITITDADTSEVLKQITLKDGVATDVNFKITGTNRVRIRWSGEDNTNTLVFGDIYMQ